MIRKKVTIENGETISYFERGTGKKVIVLIHGNVSSSYYFKPLFDKLPKDIRIIAPDLRGFGDSSYVSSFSTLKELAIDIDLLLKQLRIEEYDLLGWSLGGGVAMELTLLSKGVRSLILVSSTSHKGYPIYKKNQDGTPKIGEVYNSKEEMTTDPIQVAPMLGLLLSKNKEMMKFIYEKTIYTVNIPTGKEYELYIEEALKQGNIVDVDWALASFNLGNESNGYSQGTEEVKNIKIPVLHILGDKDFIVPVWMLQDNFNAMRSNSKIIRYTNCGHSPFVDVPDEISIDIYNFIK